MTRRELLRAAALPFAVRGLKSEAPIQKHMKITGLKTDLLKKRGAHSMAGHSRQDPRSFSERGSMRPKRHRDAN
jgi:hypothetical protein